MNVLKSAVRANIKGENKTLPEGTEITTAFKKSYPKLCKWLKKEGLIEKISDEEPEDQVTVDDAVTVDDVPVNFDDLENFNGITVDEAEKVAPTLSLDLAEEFLGIEEAGKDRVGVKNALEKQIIALTS